MKALVIYDSNFGNTKKIADVIANSLNAKSIHVSQVLPDNLDKIGLLVVGCPINGWKPTKKMQEFLASLKRNQLADINATSFDTRVKFFLHGDAAKTIASSLKKAGAKIVSKPQGFVVAGTKGPLVDGEIQKAKIWARNLHLAL